MKYAVYGVGNECINYCWEFLSRIDIFIDNGKKGQLFWGKKIVGIDEVNLKDFFIFISPVVEHYEIMEDLESRGLIQNKDFIWAANWYGDEMIPSPYGAKYWKDIENNFDFVEGNWNARVRQVAQLIPNEVLSIMDLGAGAMTLRNYIDKKIKYYPVDYCKRSSETILCDFEKKEFPDIEVDCITASGILEYVNDMDWFVKKICEYCKYAVITYNPIEILNSIFIRQTSSWKNNYTIFEIMKFFMDNGFYPCAERITKSTDVIIKFEKRKG